VEVWKCGSMKVWKKCGSVEDSVEDSVEGDHAQCSAAWSTRSPRCGSVKDSVEVWKTVWKATMRVFSRVVDEVAKVWKCGSVEVWTCGHVNVWKTVLS
jgi:hypothetical protein